MNNRQPFFKATGIVLLMMSVILTQIPVPNISASETNQEFQMDGTLLVKYTGKKESVSIPAKVTRIGAEAFADNQTLAVLTIPDTVTQIDSGAFSGCSSLEMVTFPKNLASIGSSAFHSCASLKKVVLNNTLSTIGAGAFSDCDKLEIISVNKDNQNFSFEKGILFDKAKTLICQVVAGTKAEKLTIPDTVTSIMPYAFWGCELIPEIIVPSSVKEIGPYAFSNFTSLETVELPYSLRTINLKAFSYCTKLSSITIPESVTTIHETAFDGCPLLNQEEGASNSSGTDAISGNEIQKTDSLSGDEIQKVASTSDEKNKEESDKSTETNSGNQILSTEETEVSSDTVLNETILGKTVIVGSNAVILMNNKNSKVITGELSAPGTSGVSNALSSDQSSILKQAFYRDETLSDFIIPDQVISIEEFAFARSALTNITIPETVETIGYAAFYHCEGLSEITIPDKLQFIGDKAFSKTGWMEKWLKEGESDFLVVGDGILICYKGESEIVTIPEEVKQIASGAFENHTEMIEVGIPDTVETIRANAFLNCTNLATIQGGEGISVLEEHAFDGTNILMTSEQIAIAQNSSMGQIAEYQILNKSELESKVFEMNFVKWLATVVLFTIAILFLIVRKKQP